MVLPDYRKCVEVFRLHEAMGIRVIPNVPAIDVRGSEAFEIIRELVDPEDAALATRLHRESVPVAKAEVIGLPNEALRYRGRFVCVYLRDIHQATPGDSQWRRHMYHLFFCQAVQRMKPEPSDRALLATQRSDGVFEVRDWSAASPRKIQVPLALCPDCREVLRDMGMYSSAFECQACGVDCAGATHLLHLHFEDGDPTHTAPQNLHILCVDCHALRPRHDHMLVQPLVQDWIEMVSERRSKQGIVSLNNEGQR
jgi:5-methylcytosine-specific restriction endonuclease McrA